MLSAMYMASLLIRAQAMLSALGMLEHGGRVCGPNLVQLWSAISSDFSIWRRV